MSVTVSNNFLFKVDGRLVSVAKAAEALGINRHTLGNRVRGMKKSGQFDEEFLLAKPMTPEDVQIRNLKIRQKSGRVVASAVIKGRKVTLLAPTQVLIDDKPVLIREAAEIMNGHYRTLGYRLSKLVYGDDCITLEQCFSKEKFHAKKGQSAEARRRIGAADPEMMLPSVKVNNQWLRVSI